MVLFVWVQIYVIFKTHPNFKRIIYKKETKDLEKRGKLIIFVAQLE